MSEVLWYDEHRVDGASQKMLRALGGGEWVYGRELRDAAGLGENTQVFYRMERYLEPAGLVIEAARIDEEPRQFQLTEEGLVWVEEHADEILAPATREEAVEMAREGYKAGTSAKESVQSYRKKVNRVKNRLDETREQVGEIDGRAESNSRRLTTVTDRAADNRDRSKENRSRIEGVREDVEARATAEGLESVNDDVSGVERRLTVVEDKQAGLAREQAEAARTRVLVSRLAKPAGYVAAGALAVYFVVLVAVVVLAPGLLASVLVGGATGALGVAVGVGGMVYAQGTGGFMGEG